MSFLDMYTEFDQLAQIHVTKETAERHATRAAVAKFNKAVQTYQKSFPNCNWENELKEFKTDEPDEFAYWINRK